MLARLNLTCLGIDGTGWLSPSLSLSHTRADAAANVATRWRRTQPLARSLAHTYIAHSHTEEPSQVSAATASQALESSDSYIILLDDSSSSSSSSGNEVQGNAKASIQTRSERLKRMKREKATGDSLAGGELCKRSPASYWQRANGKQIALQLCASLRECVSVCAFVCLQSAVCCELHNQCKASGASAAALQKRRTSR